MEIPPLPSAGPGYFYSLALPSRRAASLTGELTCLAAGDGLAAAAAAAALLLGRLQCTLCALQEEGGSEGRKDGRKGEGEGEGGQEDPRCPPPNHLPPRRGEARRDETPLRGEPPKGSRPLTTRGSL